MGPLRHLPKLPRLYHVDKELFDAGAMARVPTHQLLTKLGLVHHPKPGLVHWLPMGRAILTKLQDIVHAEMARAGLEQVALAALSPAALWQQLGRWAGSELFKLKDFAQADYCLAPTCEEEITALVQSQAQSYKSFPLLYYQISRKFRDEKRPRSGLLRGREFVMKDAYTFDCTPAQAMESYRTMVAAYFRVFGRLKVPFVMADADSGDIGGALSHEFHYLHESGEDTLFTCSGCGESLNIERTLSHAAAEVHHADVAVAYYTTDDRRTLVCAYYPRSRVHQPAFLKDEVPDIDLTGTLSQDQVLGLFRDEDALISKKIVRVMDLRLDSRSNFPDFPVKFINRSLITTLTDVPIVAAEEGEICHKCEEGTLVASRAIEVGHTFLLGDKYSRTFGFSVEHPLADGTLQKNNVLMGCYGIGISRVIAAVAEITRDARGLRWPACIAPWLLTVVDTLNDPAVLQRAADQLAGHGIDFRVDDRPKVRMGKKIRDSHMFGIPLVLIVGRGYPTVELELRGAWRPSGEDEAVVRGDDGLPQKLLVDISEAAAAVQKVLAAM
ncbi:prolyl-tRNA synthetase [Metschnikowia bicuspidata var. bicuspidata NRRL YB-4993]|uniref:proline--tRNA ligase n=1 Tax=Metschnikowia bicuspidata var. bicuspidata NRRL YB-4993 TaxID=869754 RepID=A0A1A0HEF8_9ASCO|nr:prolyl-tRNA synthetase [Metschnikowia bicuspidata var. bicuspidata NRRL YB-4993]OBA22288.1 prolyl-tRNA synthetase [Metschnikowia bicuspidata var. bicuspidata NRRL YB-4993]